MWFKTATLAVLIIAVLGSVGSLVGVGQDQQWTAVVRDSTGRPIQDAVVTAIAAARTGATIISTRTDASGRFRLPVSRTPANVTIWAQGHAPLLRGSVAAGQNLEADLTLPSGGEVVGTVSRAGGIPASGVMLDIVYDSSRLPFMPPLDTDGGARFTGRDGRFRLVNIMRGIPFRVEVTQGRAVIGSFGPYELGLGEEAPLSLALEVPPTRMVYGIIDSDARTPVSGAIVRMIRIQTERRFVSLTPGTLFAYSDDEGRFEFPPIMEGQFELVVTGRGYRPRRIPLAVGSARGPTNIRLSRDRVFGE